MCGLVTRDAKLPRGSAPAAGAQKDEGRALVGAALMFSRQFVHAHASMTNVTCCWRSRINCGEKYQIYRF